MGSKLMPTRFIAFAKNSAPSRKSIIPTWLACRLCLFPNLGPPANRISGRLAFTRGRYRKAEKHFNDAITAARKIGADYEQARALINRSMLEYPESNADRERGLALLESLGCVLPDAEVE
jgi:hypothetical protein